MDGRRILSVEDEPETIIALQRELELTKDIELVRVQDLAAAEATLRAVPYDLILMDLRVSRDDQYRASGGLELATLLRNGDLGPTNRHTPFAILTAFIHDINPSDLLNTADFFGVVSKTGSILTDLRLGANGALDWLPASGLLADADRMQDLLTVTGVNLSEGKATFTTGAWPRGDSFQLDLTLLPGELRQEIDFAVFPIFVWATINTSAATADELHPYGFRLCIADEQGLAAFDNPNMGDGVG